jgi:hypothetical protein
MVHGHLHGLFDLLLGIEFGFSNVHLDLRGIPSPAAAGKQQRKKANQANKFSHGNSSFFFLYHSADGIAIV